MTIQMTVRTFVHKNGALITEDNKVKSTDELKAVREWMNGKTTVTAIAINADGTIDHDGMERLLAPGKREGVTWTDAMVVDAHEMYVNQGLTPSSIMLRLFVNHDVEVSENSVKKVLKQEAYTAVTVEEGLRVMAKKKAGSGGTRRKISDEVKEAIIADMEAGMSGVAAANKHGVHKSAANAYYRAKHGHRRPR